MALYDRTGVTYSATRGTDPRIAAAIDRALDGMESVVDVGAGTGSYEPPNTSADAALAVLTVHHWTDPAAGIAEMARIAQRRIVILTWDASVMGRFWLLRDYLPAAAATDASLAVPLEQLQAVLPGRTTVTPVPVPAECTDGFAGAFWRRPEAYLDPRVRAGASMFALTDPELLETGLTRLASDLD